MTDVEAPKLWPPDVKIQLTGKDPDAGKDRKQEFEQASGDGEGQGSLACCSPQG